MIVKTSSTGSPRGVEPQPRQPQPLLEDLGVVARARARHAAADVAVVRDRDREADQLALGKTGLTTKMSGVWMPPSNGSFTM